MIIIQGIRGLITGIIRGLITGNSVVNGTNENLLNKNHPVEVMNIPT